MRNFLIRLLKKNVETKGKVYVKFPGFGLGNMMLVWARAFVFSEINNMQLVTGSWAAFRPGAWLRNEKHKRLYKDYFIESALAERLKVKFIKLGSGIIFDPELEVKDSSKSYVFTKTSNDENLFTHLFPYRSLISEKLLSIIHPKIKRELEQFAAPVIAIHIRRGDFKLDNQHTSLAYFIEQLQKIRKAFGAELEATIFSDADEDELGEILALPMVSIAAKKADLSDILLMSKANFLIMSPSSSFSYWAGFLSEGIVIRHKNDWQKQINPIHQVSSDGDLMILNPGPSIKN